MARARRRAHHSLRSDLFEQPQAYDFFQALRLIENIVAAEHKEARQPPPEPTGLGISPDHAAFRVRSTVSLGYAASEITSIRRARNTDTPEVTQTVIGLTGPSGVLPHAFSELVHISVRERNPGLRDFLDLFNNRLAGLLYEAWAKHRIVVEHDRSTRMGTPKPIDKALKALAGMGLASLSGRLATGDDMPVYFGGHFARSSRSTHAVEQVLSSATGNSVRVEQFQGKWLPIAAADQTVLPGKTLPQGRFCQLGENMVVGRRIFDIQSTVRLLIGPLSYATFRTLLPDGASARGFTDLAAVALGPDIAFRLSLELTPSEILPLQLARSDNPTTGSRLGWNTWLYTERLRENPTRVDIDPVPHLR